MLKYTQDKKKGYQMQTIKLEIEDSKLNIVLNIIQNLKDDLIMQYEVIHNNIEQTDESSETEAFSNHSAALIEEWKDRSEDSIWN